MNQIPEEIKEFFEYVSRAFEEYNFYVEFMEDKYIPDTYGKEYKPIKIIITPPPSLIEKLEDATIIFDEEYNAYLNVYEDILEEVDCDLSVIWRYFLLELL